MIRFLLFAMLLLAAIGLTGCPPDYGDDDSPPGELPKATKSLECKCEKCNCKKCLCDDVSDGGLVPAKSPAPALDLDAELRAAKEVARAIMSPEDFAYAEQQIEQRSLLRRHGYDPGPLIPQRAVRRAPHSQCQQFHPQFHAPATKAADPANSTGLDEKTDFLCGNERDKPTDQQVKDFAERQRKELREFGKRCTSQQLKALRAHLAFYTDELEQEESPR